MCPRCTTRATSAPASASACWTTASTGIESTRRSGTSRSMPGTRATSSGAAATRTTRCPTRPPSGTAASCVPGRPTLSVVAGNAPGIYIGPGYGSNLSLGRTEYDPTEKPIEMVFWGMGAEWADSLGCDIISSSLGYNLFPDSAGTDITYPMLDGHTTIVTRAAEIAAAKGMLVVISAGNGGANTSGVVSKISAPADADGDSVIAIGAVDSLGVRASFSSKGPTYDGRIKPDLAAQGRAVLMAATTCAHEQVTEGSWPIRYRRSD